VRRVTVSPIGPHAWTGAPETSTEAHMLTRQTFGIPGLLGAVLLLAWLIGFLVLGLHGMPFHLLVPIAGLLMIAQGVRRVNHED
jgi:hypothetical protein